jgi:Uncharacterized conserved protein
MSLREMEKSRLADVKILFLCAVGTHSLRKRNLEFYYTSGRLRGDITTMKEIFTPRNLRHGFLVVFGCLLSAVGINMFLSSAGLYSGGLSGIAILVQYSLGIPSGYVVGIVNIPLLFLSYKKLNTRFTVFSIIGTVIYSILLIVTKNLQDFLSLHDTLLYCIYGGALNGVGIGLAFSNHGSTGGFNIISLLIKRKYDGFDVGQIQFAANLLIVIIGVALYGLPIGLYTALSMFITSFVTDKLIHGLSRKKILFIITEKDGEVCAYIKANIQRGATVLHGETLAGTERKILYCVVQLSHLPEMKLAILSIDPNSIISVVDAAEVDGKGYTASIL